MKTSIQEKLAQLTRRKAEIDGLLGSEEAIRDMDNYRRLTREHAEIEPVVALYGAYRKAEADLAGAQEMASDPEMKSLIEDEIRSARETMQRLEDELQRLL